MEKMIDYKYSKQAEIFHQLVTSFLLVQYEGKQQFGISTMKIKINDLELI